MNIHIISHFKPLAASHLMRKVLSGQMLSHRVFSRVTSTKVPPLRRRQMNGATPAALRLPVCRQSGESTKQEQTKKKWDDKRNPRILHNPEHCVPAGGKESVGRERRIAAFLGSLSCRCDAALCRAVPRRAALLPLPPAACNTSCVYGHAKCSCSEVPWPHYWPNNVYCITATSFIKGHMARSFPNQVYDCIFILITEWTI